MPSVFVITPASRQVGCMVIARVFPPVAGLTEVTQRMLPKSICGFITEKRNEHRRIAMELVGLVGIEPTTSTMST